MKCGLCKFKARSRHDFEHHVQMFHKLTLDQYRTAVAAVQPAIQGLDAFKSAAKKTGFLVAILAVLLLPGCGKSIASRIFGPDTHDTIPGTEAWQKPDCVNLTTEQCCNLDAAHQSMCQTLHIGGF